VGQTPVALKIFERHLAREIYASTGLVLLAFLMLFAFFDLIHQLESVGAAATRFSTPWGT
jgi:lipopolysaccharide export system permease protein